MRRGGGISFTQSCARGLRNMQKGLTGPTAKQLKIIFSPQGQLTAVLQVLKAGICLCVSSWT